MNELYGSLTLLDPSGQFIIGAIGLVLASSLIVNLVARIRYRQILNDLRDAVPNQAFAREVLNRIVHDAQSAARARTGDIDPQGIVEQRFGSELGGLIIVERYVRAAPGLVIILGLVGTFYGLTLSIGKLSALVGDQVADVGAVTTALTAGLTQALSGMSVAFTTSLVGIAAAIVLTLLGVFFNVTDRRTSLMVEVENYIDRVLTPQFGLAAQGATSEDPSGGTLAQGTAMAQAAHHFAESVSRLQSSVTQFDSSLQAFATSTRDFQEFNLHLKDNVQRMSLTFADLSNALQTEAVRQRRPNPS